MKRVNVGEAYKEALEYIKKKENLDKALHILNQILNHTLHTDKIKRYEILYSLGVVNMILGFKFTALMYYQETLKEKPEMIEAINNIGFIYKEEGLRPEAEKSFAKVYKLLKKYKEIISPEEHCQYEINYGTMHICNGTPNEAIEIFNRAEKSVPEDNYLQREIKWNRALAYLEKGDYANGFREYEFGKRILREENRNYSKTTEITPYWNGEKGKTVVVFGEQGIGDEIMFASMIPDLVKDCKTVIVDAHLRLMSIFRNSFPGLIIYGSREQQSLPWAKWHDIDYKIHMGSLGKFYRHKDSDFPRNPYLKADEKLVEKYAEKLKDMNDKPKIGISWKGGVLSTSPNRHIPLELFKDLFATDAYFFSLQYNTDSASEIEQYNKDNGTNIMHWAETLDDYDETAALVSHLDLVISVPQSVVHLAGAMGVPTWQICPKKAMWQKGPYNRDMPWYGSVHNIWQEQAGEWKPTLKKIKEKLCSLLANNTGS